MRPIAAALAALVAAASEAAACLPPPLNVDRVAEQLARSEHAFRGAVAEVDPGSADAKEGRVRFGVEQIVKGTPRPGDWYRYIKYTNQHCFGWTPSTGQRGVFFVHRNKGEAWVTIYWGLDGKDEMLREALLRARPRSQ